MKDRLSKNEILSKYGDSDMVVDLRSLLKEKEGLSTELSSKEEKSNSKKEKRKREKKKTKSLGKKRSLSFFNRKNKELESTNNILFSEEKDLEKKDKKERRRQKDDENYKEGIEKERIKKASIEKERIKKESLGKENIRKLRLKLEKKKKKKKADSFSLSSIFSKKKKKNKTIKLLKRKRKGLLNSFSSFLDKPSMELRKKFSKKKRRPAFPRLPGFLIALLLLMIPLKVFSSLGFLDFKNIENKVFNNSFKAVDNIVSASDSLANLNFKEADINFDAASLNFLAAEKELSKINSSLLLFASMSSDPKIKLASQSKKLLQAGLTASSLAKSLLASSDSLLAESTSLNTSLDSFVSNISLSLEEAEKLILILEDIKISALPLEYQTKFSDLKSQLNFLVESLNEVVRLSDKLKDVLGLSIDKRYLLVFQNNAEIRASGGFLGSYALVDIREGKIRNLEVPAGGSYDLEAGLKGKKFSSPYPLHLVNPLWNFWDANWWPAWPKTARHLMWFYEQSSGPSVDGVIGLTPTVVEKLLKITGPIDMREEYGLVIDSDNFWETVQKVVEYKNLEISHPDSLEGIASTSSLISVDIPLEQDLENNPDNKPKKIIGDLMARLLEILPDKINLETLPEIASLITSSVSEKHVLFYFKDEKLQEEALRYGLAGELKDYDHDYLLVVDSNIAGQKTDKLIRQEVSLESKLQKNGQVVNTLTIERHHPGEKNKALTGVRNVNWLRVYVPLNSELISFKGSSLPNQEYFDDYDEEAILLEDLKNEREAEIDEDSGSFIYNEDGYRVFANWTMTDPGEISKVEIKYLLPFNFNNLEAVEDTWLNKAFYWLNPKLQESFPYSLVLQKQAGAKSFPFNYKFKISNNYELSWSSENKQSLNDGYLFKLEKEINRDRFFGSILKKKNTKN